MKLYLSGPMRGHEDLNFPAFAHAAWELRQAGYVVFNPAETGLTEIRECFRADTDAICDSDGIATLYGWHDSRGARAEVALAEAIGLPVKDWYDWATKPVQPPPLLVGVSGYARAGKDTVAGFLVEHAGFEQRSFAKALKDALLVLNPTVGMDNGPAHHLRGLVAIFGWEYVKDHSHDARSLLQRMGTDVGRKMFGDDVWVDIAMRDLPDKPVVFADCRFPNEAKAIKAAGGQVWRIERPGHAPVNAHPSETALDDWDFDLLINNNSTLDALRSTVLRSVQHTQQKEN